MLNNIIIYVLNLTGSEKTNGRRKGSIICICILRTLPPTQSNIIIPLPYRSGVNVVNVIPNMELH